MNKYNYKYNNDGDMYNVYMAVLQQVFKDIKGCAHSYYYYVVDERTRETYRMNDVSFCSLEKLLYGISEQLKLAIDEDITVIVELCLTDPEYFITEYFNRLNRLYPKFCEHYKVRIKEIKNVYRGL